MRYLLIYIAVIGACLFGFSQNRFYSECGFLRGGIYILADGEDTFPRLKDTILFEAQLPIYEWNERDSFTKMIKPVVDDFVVSIFRRGKKWNSSFFIQTPPVAKDTAGNILDSIRIAGFYVYTEFTNLSVMSDDRYGRELPNGVLVYVIPTAPGKARYYAIYTTTTNHFPKVMNLSLQATRLNISSSDRTSIRADYCNLTMTAWTTDSGVLSPTTRLSSSNISMKTTRIPTYTMSVRQS